ncbi:MAG: SCO family protein [Ardenticatenaceae bacterium]|nr:SCO family protein [Anaerolineales bacterium]MCB8940847.1 SCO family protein [Ardenticatenaceae bacterium]MCB8972186.1 SCO family protein [Ardenticatenaceae bacterium]
MTETTNDEQIKAPFWKSQLFRLALIGLGIGVGIGALFLAIRPLFGPSEWHGMEIQASQPVTNFTLTGPGEQPVSLVDYRGEVVMLYFGYTFCPDVCPATMVELRDAMEILGKRAEDVQVMMISVDPERDTPEILEAYLAHFDESFIGLTGTTDEIMAVTAPMGIFFERHEGSAASGYLVDHTATVAVLDKEGKLRLIYPFGITGAEMAADLKYLVRE